MDAMQGILNAVSEVFWYAWWLWVPLLLFPLFESTWLFWRQQVFKHELEFVHMEIRIPREVTKSPRAMEQVLMTVHNLRNAPADPEEKWWDGEVTRWYALEIVSFGGEIHLYVRAWRKQKEIIQAAFFANYPDVEIVETDDYIDRLPASVGEMYKSGYDLWGSEFILEREPAYPIRSYMDFESPDEEKQFDPMSTFLEVLGKVKREEMLCIQYLIRPASMKWRDKYQPLVEALRTRHQKIGGAGGAKPTIGMEFPHILPTFPVKQSGGDEDALRVIGRAIMTRTPGETDVLKAVEENLSLPPFETLIRFVYLSPKELYFDTLPRRGLRGAFNQYAAADLNWFERNERISTRVKIWDFPFFFPHARLDCRKSRVLADYRAREIPPETSVGKIIRSKFLHWEHSRMFLLSVRSLATLFHPPTYQVLTAPHIKRVESRKTGAPAGLAIYGGEEEMEKFK
ncbi:MAG: hypothetical protein ABSE18_01845 [Minisyncoccia bacterium]